MLKRLGFFGSKKLETGKCFELPERVTVDEVNRSCFLESVTTRERINLTLFPVKSSCSLLVTYKKIRELNIVDLAGHMFPLPRLLEPEPTVKVLGRDITKQFLVTDEIFHDHITMLLSETSLSSSTQERLATHLSQRIYLARNYRKGFMIQVEIRDVENHIIHIGYGCKGREACPRRVISDRHVRAKVTGTDYAICLTELSSGVVCRLELRCSHVFHGRCVLKWLGKNTSCPVCRAKAVGETALYY